MFTMKTKEITDLCGIVHFKANKLKGILFDELDLDTTESCLNVAIGSQIVAKYNMNE